MNDYDKIYEKLYKMMCANCEREHYCHNACEECEDFQDNLEKLEKGEEIEI